MAEANHPATEVANIENITAPMSAIEAQSRGEIDIQIATARRYPRDIATFMRKAETYATISDDIAASCFYKLKRRSSDGDKFIEGPSVRLAEIVAAAYGHMRIDARTVNEDDRFVYSQGLAWDLQENVAIRFEVRRRISGNRGRYNDDMIATTANAATAIALRNAVFRVIPKAFWEPIYERAKEVAVGTTKTLGERRQKMLDYFTQKMRVPQEAIFKHLEIDGVESMSLQHVETLRGIATALKEGDTTVEKEFYGKSDEGPALREKPLDSTDGGGIPESLPKPQKEQAKVVKSEPKQTEKSTEEKKTDASLETVEGVVKRIEAATAENWDALKEESIKLLPTFKANSDKLAITRAVNRKNAEIYPS